MADFIAVACLIGCRDIAGIDDIRDMTLTDRIGNFARAVAYLFKNVGTDAVALQERSGALGRFDIEAEIVEAADERKCFLLILIRNGYEHGAVVLEVHTRCLKCLIECAVELIVVADSFTCGLHFGREVCIESADLIEGEHGNLYVPALLFVGINIEYSLLLEALSENYLGRDIRKAIARCFGEEGYGTRGR